jgi:hypothetical protein
MSAEGVAGPKGRTDVIAVTLLVADGAPVSVKAQRIEGGA